MTSYSYISLIKDIFRYIRPYRWKFLFGSLLRISGDLMYLYATYLLAVLIAETGKHMIGESADHIWFFLIIWTATYVFVHVSRQLAKYVCYQVAERAKLDVQLQAFHHLNFLDIAWHEKENSGNKIKRVEKGGEGADRLIRIWVDQMIEIAVNVVGMIVIVAFTDTTIALIMGIFVATYIMVTFPLSRRASKAARVVNQEEEDFAGISFEIINNIRTVKVMGMFHALFPRLEAASSRVYVAVIARIRRFRFLSFVQTMWGHVFRVGIIVIIVQGILGGRYDVAFLLLFNFYFGNLRTSVEEFSQISQDIIIVRYNFARLHAILQEPVRIDDERDKIDMPRDWKKITLRNVSFAYGDHPVLDNISFEIHRGEKIGIVGLSGAGKSTLFKLLLKEYEDFSGDILFDDISIRTIKKSSYFERVAVVLQDTEVFNFSLRDNITLAKTAPTEEQFTQALGIAHVVDFLGKLPHGTDTLIGEKGVKLSGGEKQRLGIARAVVRQPDVLFLDEATSHLDLESEEKIQDSLHQFFQQVTAIVIAHRLTTIQEMDRIFLIENGKLLESGNFKTLHRRHGRFFELWEKQKL